MFISKIEALDKGKYKVSIDGENAFVLYDKDIKTYELIEGQEISCYSYDKIIEDTVLRRSKQKALAILKFSDRSETELRRRLSESYYPEDVIQRTIEYVTEYGYLNDERFAGIYVRARKERKSKQILKQELLLKGIKKEILDTIFKIEYETEEEDPELTALRKAIEKKTKDISQLSWEEKQKLIAQLYRKGFDIDKIKHILG